jgi:long-chain acyl-CoA synthetase
VTLDFLFEVFRENEDEKAIYWLDTSCTYGQLYNDIEKNIEFLKIKGINRGSVVCIVGDYSPSTIGLLLALIVKRCIIVPLTLASLSNKSKLFEIAQVEFLINVGNDKVPYVEKFEEVLRSHTLLDSIRSLDQPGLILFTSGSSGEPKAAVHNFTLLLEKFKKKRKALRTINFLLFDHWGGLNTLFFILSNGGVVIGAHDRSPGNVCALIEKHKIQLLPASPTFLNLLLLSGSTTDFDMSSLEIISYGTEPMPKSTLKRLQIHFPDVRLLQTYGLIELGVLRSKSQSNDSLWVKVGGEGYETRVVDEMLEIKAQSAMLGYLNAPSPFTDDGWFKTGDSVEVKGEYIKILGRKSELINVGGEKVYPQEVENIILDFRNVADVTVYGEKHPLVGNIVCARIVLKESEELKIFKSHLKKYCAKRMKKHMAPVKIILSNDKMFNNRFKKTRMQ